MLSLSFRLRFTILLLLITSAFLIDNNYAELYPDLESDRLNSFPHHKISLHMPCVESNMFATNCACHIRCLEPSCKQAWELCEKYKIRYISTRDSSYFRHLASELLTCSLFVNSHLHAINIYWFRTFSKGCKYVLFRGSKNNKIATLKRKPTAEELKRYVEIPASVRLFCFYVKAFLFDLTSLFSNACQTKISIDQILCWQLSSKYARAWNI